MKDHSQGLLFAAAGAAGIDIENAAGVDLTKISDRRRIHLAKREVEKVDQQNQLALTQAEAKALASKQQLSLYENLVSARQQACTKSARQLGEFSGQLEEIKSSHLAMLESLFGVVDGASGLLVDDLLVQIRTTYTFVQKDTGEQPPAADLKSGQPADEGTDGNQTLADGNASDVGGEQEPLKEHDTQAEAGLEQATVLLGGGVSKESSEEEEVFQQVDDQAKPDEGHRNEAD